MEERVGVNELHRGRDLVDSFVLVGAVHGPQVGQRAMGSDDQKRAHPLAARTHAVRGGRPDRWR